MYRIIHIFAFAAFLIGCQFFSTDPSSTEPDEYAGGGTRTTNGEVAGRIKFPDASPAEGVQIRLYKVFLAHENESYSAEWAGLSDSLGNFSFRDVPAGNFAMSVMDRIAGTKAIMPRISKGREGFVIMDAVLSPWVTLKGRVFPSDSASPENIQICIPGLPNCIKPGPDSVYIYPEAPQGNFDLVFLYDDIANYLPIRATRSEEDTLYLRDIELDPAVASSPRSGHFYETSAEKSVYILPAVYGPGNRPGWYTGKKFDRIQYFTSASDNPLQQWNFEDYKEWSHSRIIEVPAYRPQSAGNSVQVNFPHYLRLTGMELDFSQVASEGTDIRISSESGKHLTYHIARWDSARGLADLWVNIDTLRSAATPAKLVLYWGNPDAEDRSDPMAALGPIPEARHLWPLDDNVQSSLVSDLRGTHPGYLTRIGLGKDLTVNHAVAGVLGGALRLDGIRDQITIDPHHVLDSPQMTLSVWAKNSKSTLSVQQYIVRKGEGGKKQWHLALDATNKIRVAIGNSEKKQVGVWVSKNAVEIDQWHQYTFTFQAGVVRAYLDGEALAGTVFGYFPKAIPGFNSTLMLGQRIVESEQFWSGDIDNLMLEDRARDPDWVRMLYQTQKPVP